MDNLHGFYTDFFVNGKKNLLKLTCKDFLNEAWSYLEISEIENLIEEKFKKSLEPDEKKLLMLRFRHAPCYFQCITDMSLRSEHTAHADEEQIICFLKQCAREQRRDCSEMQKRFEAEIHPKFEESMEQLRENIRKKAKESGNEALNGKNPVDTKKERKKEEKKKLIRFYQRLLYERNTSAKYNVSEAIRQYIKKYMPEKKFNTVRRSYERWSKQYSLDVPKEKWPTKEFIRFFSLICVYVQDIRDDIKNLQSAVLLKNSDPQTRFFWQDTRDFRRGENQNIQSEEFSKLLHSFSQNLNHVWQIRRMKDLVRRGNNDAKAWLLKEEVVDNAQIKKKYEIQLALQDYEDYRLKRGWAQEFLLPPFNSKGTDFGLANRELDADLHGILPSTMVTSLEFVGKFGKYPENEFYFNYKSKEIPSEPESKLFIVPHPKIYELDEIMQLNDALQELTFCFSTGQKLICTRNFIGSPTPLPAKTIDELEKISSFIASFHDLPGEVQFSLNDLQRKIKAELQYSDKAARLIKKN